MALSVTTGALVWSSVPAAGISTPVLDDSGAFIYMASDYHGVFKLNAKSGETIWNQRETWDELMPPAVGNGSLVVTTTGGALDGGMFYGLDSETGRIRWSLQQYNLVNQGAVIYEGIGLIATTTILYAFVASSGFQLWNFSTASVIYTAPVTFSDVVFFGTGDGTLFALNVRTGAVRWKLINPIGAIFNTPAFAEGSIFFGTEREAILHYNDSYYRVRAADGALVWNQSVYFSFNSGFTIVHDDLAFNSVTFGNNGDGIAAFRISDGYNLWSWLAPNNDQINGLGVYKGALFCGSLKGFIYALAF